MPCRDADCGMDKLMREDGRDLRRHRVGRVRQVRADEDFKMSVRAQAVVPALADRLALRASAGEADRHAHAVGQGGVQRLEQRGHALRHRIEPAFTGLVGHRPYSLRSEEHTSELQSLMRISYAVFCLKKKNITVT